MFHQIMINMRRIGLSQEKAEKMLMGDNDNEKTYFLRLAGYTGTALQSALDIVKEEKKRRIKEARAEVKFEKIEPTSKELEVSKTQEQVVEVIQKDLEADENIKRFIESGGAILPGNEVSAEVSEEVGKRMRESIKQNLDNDAELFPIIEPTHEDLLVLATDENLYKKDPNLWLVNVKELIDSGIDKKAIAKSCGISRNTLYKRLGKE